MSRRRPILAGRWRWCATATRITLDVAARTINLDVPEAELTKNAAPKWKPPETRFERGYGWMFTRHIMQANERLRFFDFFWKRVFGAPVGGAVDLLSHGRHSGMVRRTRPGISRFRVRAFAPPRNDVQLG